MSWTEFATEPEDIQGAEIIYSEDRFTGKVTATIKKYEKKNLLANMGLYKNSRHHMWSSGGGLQIKTGREEGVDREGTIPS